MVQETLFAAWKGQKGFRDDSSLRTWMTGILKYKIIDYIRYEIRHRNIMDAMQNDPSSTFDSAGHYLGIPNAWKDCPEYQYNKKKNRAALEFCIGTLPEKQQTVYRMREIIGDDTEVICKKLNITSVYVNVLFYRARQSLHKCLVNDCCF